MIRPKLVRKTRPHFIQDNRLVFSRGNAVYEGAVSDPAQAKRIGYYRAGLIRDLGARFDLTKRAGRLGYHDLKPFKNGYLGVQHGSIVWKDREEQRFSTAFQSFRGSRPLGLFVHPTKAKAYFGEYFANAAREEVYIYASDNGRDWYKAWTFEAGSIRHIHGLTWDPYRKGIWVLTGDSDQESGLWYTDDDFKSLSRVAGGTQKARAVEIIPVRDGLIVPMDSPLERNYIHLYDIPSGGFRVLSPLPGSAFHATATNGIYLVSTVTEPSTVNVVDYASVWGSLDGQRWKEISRFKKDLIPVKYQFIGRYAEVYFPHGDNRSNFIIGYGQALQGMSDCMLVWEKARLVDFLKG